MGLIRYLNKAVLLSEAQYRANHYLIYSAAFFMTIIMLTQEELKRLFDYDKETGIFTRKISTCNRVNIGDVAGSKMKIGYLLINISNKKYYAHRLAWFYEYGAWPKDKIDHINGIRNDNRICNLREVNNRKNGENQRNPTINNKTGFLGVYFHKQAKKYCVQIGVMGKTKYIGLFIYKEDAYNAYIKAKREFHDGCTL